MNCKTDDELEWSSLHEIIAAMNAACQTDDIIKLEWNTQNISERLQCCSEYLDARKYLCDSCRKYLFCIEHMDETYQIKCFYCDNNMNYVHYIFCNGKCLWCWKCWEFQHINVNKECTGGHDVTCTNK